MKLIIFVTLLSVLLSQSLGFHHGRHSNNGPEGSPHQHQEDQIPGQQRGSSFGLENSGGENTGDKNGYEESGRNGRHGEPGNHRHHHGHRQGSSGEGSMDQNANSFIEIEPEQGSVGNRNFVTEKEFGNDNENGRCHYGRRPFELDGSNMDDSRDNENEFGDERQHGPGNHRHHPGYRRHYGNRKFGQEGFGGEQNRGPWSQHDNNFIETDLGQNGDQNIDPMPENTEDSNMSDSSVPDTDDKGNEHGGFLGWLRQLFKW